MNVNLIKHSVLSALTFVSATCASAKEELPYYEYPKDVTAVEDNTLFDYPVKMLYTPLAT